MRPLCDVPCVRTAVRLEETAAINNEGTLGATLAGPCRNSDGIRKVQKGHFEIAPMKLQILGAPCSTTDPSTENRSTSDSAVASVEVLSMTTVPR